MSSRTYISAMRGSGPADPEFLAWAETYANHLDHAVSFRIEEGSVRDSMLTINLENMDNG